MQTFKKILIILTPSERKQAGLLLLMILIMALLDMIGVASILPFMAVLTNPSLIETNLILNNFYQLLNSFVLLNKDKFLLILGLIVLFLLVLSLFFKALTTYAQVRFSEMRQFSISKRLIEAYLQKPYSWSLNQNSAEIGKTILSEVGVVVGVGIGEFLQLVAKGSIVISLLSLLIFADPKLAIFVGLTLCILYGAIFNFFRNYLNKIGKERLKNNDLRFRAVSEAFSAVKEVKVGGLEKIYTDRFSKPALSYASTSASSQIIKQLPRFFLEGIIFGGVMLVVLYLIKKTGSFSNSLPVLSLYVFAGYRLLPALQQVYASLTQISFAGPSIDKLYDDIIGFKSIEPYKSQNTLKLEKILSLKNISYYYPNSSKTTLNNISINIPAKSTVGLVGTTGSGKTTMVDIILGLLEPQSGILEVDGKTISKKNLRSWQKSIGYVPQNIYLADNTVAANIAFGKEPHEINYDAVEKASRIANLHNFITEELPNKYKTNIGERGIRLSGGQRQRIGVARALYNNPNVLILDEATSALDIQTEKSVMDAVINSLGKNITIIIIAHRLNTLMNCDLIFRLNKGKVVDQGTFKQLINPSDILNFTTNNL